METTVLVVARTDDEHVPPVAKALVERGVTCVRVDSSHLPQKVRVAARFPASRVNFGFADASNVSIDLGAIDAIWWQFAPPPEVDSMVLDLEARQWALDESSHLINGCWHVAAAKWVPAAPHVIQVAQHKILQLSLATKHGLSVPSTVVSNDAAEVIRFYEDNAGRIISKTLSRRFIGADGRDRVAHTRIMRRRDLSKLHALRHGPAIFQSLVPKAFELRVTVVGAQLFATEIHALHAAETRDDWRRPSRQLPTLRVHELPERVASACHRMVASLGLCSGAFDFVVTPDGEYVFLELNPDGSWSWVQRATGQPIAEATASLLIEKAQR